MSRLAVVLTSALLTLAPAAPALAQSAGDEQYSDPFAGAGTSTAEPATSTPPAPAPAPAPAAPADPAAPAAEGTAPGSEAAPTAAAPSTLPTQLAYTGADPRVVALLGATLLLLGIGLRLRTADARR